MKSNYSSPTIFNASNMELTAASHGRNAIAFENRLEDLTGILALSGAMRLLVGLRDVGFKSESLPKKKI